MIERSDRKCEVRMNGMQLEHVSEFKQLGCALDESGIDKAECRRKVASDRKNAGAIRSRVNGNCSRVLHETLFVPPFMYSSETMI